MKTKLALLFALMFSVVLSAQKSAPVAGDAAQLIDLLKKDYSTINQNTKDDVLFRDRAKAISIFKSYLIKVYDTTSYAINLNNKLVLEAVKSLKDEQKRIISLENELKELIEQNPIIKDGGIRAGNTLKIKGIRERLIIKKESVKKYRWAVQKNELAELEKQYKANPYLIATLKTFVNKYDNINSDIIDLSAKANYNSSIQKSIPFLGGDLAFETLIDGLSQFLAKRIKAELTNYVMQNIKTKLENPNPESLVNELLVLLPLTAEYIKSFNADEILNFTNEFKQYIESDLNNILVNAHGLKETPRFQKIIENKPDLAFAFEALSIIPQLSKVKHPIDYFDLLENTTLITEWSTEKEKAVEYNIANTIKLASLLAHSMIVVDNNEMKFASTRFMSNYGNEPEFLLMYFGFLNQQNLKYYNVTFNNQDSVNPKVIGLNFEAFMNKITPVKVIKGDAKIKELQTALSLITNNAEKLYHDAILLKKTSSNESSKIKIESVHAFVTSFTDLFEQVVNTSDLLIKNGNDIGLINGVNLSIKEKLSPFINTTRSANNIVLDLHHKKYSTALIGALNIPLSFNKFKDNKSLLTGLQAIENVEYLTYSKDLFKKFKSLPTSLSSKEQLKDILEYLYSRSKVAIIKTDINELISSLDHKEQYKVNLKILKENLMNFDVQKAVLEDVANIDLEASIDKLTAKISDSNIKDKLEKNINLLIETTFNNTIESNNKNLEKFNTAKKDLKRTLRVYFPELTASIINIENKNTLKVIHFVNDIAISENAEDVEKALDAFALPTGSYSVKREAKQNVSINSYPGLFTGLDFSKYNNEKGDLGVGLTAPVGLSVNVYKNLSLFVPIIDIAAPVRLRLDGNKNTKSLPEFKFKNVFTPGLYFSYAIKKTPFAVNLGTQYGPELSFEDNEDGTLSSNFSKDSFSVNLAFTIDIPLFTIYNRPRD